MDECSVQSEPNPYDEMYHRIEYARARKREHIDAAWAYRRLLRNSQVNMVPYNQSKMQYQLHMANRWRHHEMKAKGII